jgi:hypothetical protein
VGREKDERTVTHSDEHVRPPMDDHRFIAKVGVAGSNPVVRSKTDSLTCASSDETNRAPARCP